MIKKMGTKIGDCWIWPMGKTTEGYGMMSKDGKTLKAHRVFFEAIYGGIPKGLEIDHLCRNRGCVNPFHLDAVSHWENVMRGKSIPAFNRLKIVCSKGHTYTKENTYIYPNGRRACRLCRATAVRNWRLKINE